MEQPVWWKFCVVCIGSHRNLQGHQCGRAPQVNLGSNPVTDSVRPVSAATKICKGISVEGHHS
eukprot:1157481-Pelagomonas_calceolata.AAC.3